MSLAVLLGIGVLGGAGAVARVALTAAVTARAGARLPWGTFAVNLLGAFALGVVAGAGLQGDGRRLVATGLLGAFTTFSTWMLEAARLGDRRRAALYLGASLVLGLAAALAGREAGSALDL